MLRTRAVPAAELHSGLVVQILEYNQQTVLQWPQGSVDVQGADNGLIFDFYLNKTRPEQMFDPSLFRTVNISYAGASTGFAQATLCAGVHEPQYPRCQALASDVRWASWQHAERSLPRAYCPRSISQLHALYAGVDPVVKELHTYQYGVALESNQSCAQQIRQRATLTAEAARHNQTADFGQCAQLTP